VPVDDSVARGILMSVPARRCRTRHTHTPVGHEGGPISSCFLPLCSRSAKTAVIWSQLSVAGSQPELNIPAISSIGERKQ